MKEIKENYQKCQNYRNTYLGGVYPLSDTFGSLSSFGSFSSKEVSKGSPNPKYEAFKQQKNLRHIENNEVIFDVDNRDIGFEAINFIGVNLYQAGFSFEIYYAAGQKSPHLHIKNIAFLDSLNKEQLKTYKEAFMRKFCPPEYIKDLDFSLCPSHLIAEENKPHFKYKTIKKLCGVFNESNVNEPDYELLDKVEKTGGLGGLAYNPVVKGSGITAKITKQISIIEIARQFGLSVDSRGFALCPFHPDNKPSLKFYENQGRFICFGCRESGNIIYFYALLKEINPNFKYHNQGVNRAMSVYSLT